MIVRDLKNYLAKKKVGPKIMKLKKNKTYYHPSRTNLGNLHGSMFPNNFSSDGLIAYLASTPALETPQLLPGYGEAPTNRLRKSPTMLSKESQPLTIITQVRPSLPKVTTTSAL